MGVTLDCPDAKALSAFYAELLGKPVTFEADGMAMIGNDGEHPVLFQQVASYTAPRWPDPAYPQQFHLDVEVDDIEAAEPAVLALGATRLPGGGETYRVYATRPASRSASAATWCRGRGDDATGRRAHIRVPADPGVGRLT
jgi:catechol-2,3-dioxygenase